MADAFAPALLLYHPPRGLRDNGLAGNCNRSARSVSRTGECDMLRLARALVRNATHPTTALTTAARFGRVRPLRYSIAFWGTPTCPGTVKLPVSMFYAVYTVYAISSLALNYP